MSRRIEEMTAQPDDTYRIDVPQTAADLRTAANAIVCACELLALAEASAVDRIAHIAEAREMLPDLLPLAEAIEAAEAAEQRRDNALARAISTIERHCGLPTSDDEAVILALHRDFNGG